MTEMTFEQAVEATRARLGKEVCVRIVDERGRVQNFGRGQLAPGAPDATDAAVDEEGRIAFRVAPGHWCFLLHPGIPADAFEELDGKELRVELQGGGAIVIETLGATAAEPALQTPPTRAELRKAAARRHRERARLEARERAR